MAIVSQSGTIGAALAMRAEEEGIGFSAFVSLGNKVDVDEVDLLRYFADDVSTQVICMYLEGVTDGRAFMAAAREASGKKGVVVLKGGKTRAGRRAAQSHTRSVAGSDEAFTAACRQSGVSQVSDIDQLYDAGKALGALKRPGGRRLFVVTSSGGSGILATDAAEMAGLEVPSLPEDLSWDLASRLPGHCVVGNPLDLTGDADAERYGLVLDMVMDRPDVFDACVVIFGDPIAGASSVIERVSSITQKPLVISYLGGGDVEKEETRLIQRLGIPVFPTPERAVRAFGLTL
jgi:acyl-CoA synthetase (NDP forming)